MKTIVDIDIRSPWRSSFFLVVGQNGGVGRLGGFHGCVGEFFCLCYVAPIDCGFFPVFWILYGLQELSTSVVGPPIIVYQFVCSPVVSALHDCSLFVPLLRLVVLDPHPVSGSEVKLSLIHI